MDAFSSLTLAQVLEALIFASPKPIATAELVAAVRAAGESSDTDAAQSLRGADEAQVLEAIAEIEAALEATGRSFRLLEQATGWGFVTRPELAPWVRQLYPEAKPARLSGPALETLAIIAYRQPVTRADIEAVRGVAVDGVMQVLLDRSLVRIAGRAEQPGRPLLYATTDYFLEHFGLKSTVDLPNARELSRMPLPTAPPQEEKPAGRRKGRGADALGDLTPELPLGDSERSPSAPSGGGSGHAQSSARVREDAPVHEATEGGASLEFQASAGHPTPQESRDGGVFEEGSGADFLPNSGGALGEGARSDREGEAHGSPSDLEDNDPAMESESRGASSREDGFGEPPGPAPDPFHS